MEKGLVHIYTGDGKGKTSAAVGLAIRAYGHDLNVAYACFLKRPGLYGYNEINVLRKLGAMVFVFTEGHPFFNRSINLEKLKQDIEIALQQLQLLIHSEKTDLLIMDEILVAVRDGFLEEQRLIDFIGDKPATCELVLTGRGATPGLKETADYVTNLTKEKHPFDRGIRSREGIEY
ncbi:cob(I)yrinic acid a,c-diamide adenosyltransferase [Maribellus sp. YY47]|uniref:cob(I)yrinic acid a,c-diamide adenosyltransferase n=1 Tax=Maribellus sp. YY47 TaxID=2929486 RepID=UPI002000BE41|nr:cob(I)yrinic acid a,c-diamide adenosyltransferase [Maribellus sp. YY47]MCK3685230.1 cob(I)yrinic acid a,c-diamide adenosyltransferase [Maribellus sp. YY47]